MRRPHISVNLAISADGKISSAGHIPSRWTSQADSRRLLDLRAGKDALLIGRGTLESDQMTLTVPGQKIQPLRCIVSRRGGWNEKHPLFSKRGGPIHLLVTESKTQSQGIPGAALHYESLADFLTTLFDSYNVQTLHCEGGGGLVRALAELDAIDEIFLTLAGHTLFSGGQAPTLTGLLSDFLPSKLVFQLRECQIMQDESECFLHYQRAAADPAQ
ncbi:MAG: RibD family protein [Verrucomicrobia bacterium]|nr:MAG: RibD family protein [Verrucomicrobiota bacterium]